MLLYRCDECLTLIEDKADMREDIEDKADMREDNDGCHLCPSCFREWQDNEIEEEGK